MSSCFSAWISGTVMDATGGRVRKSSLKLKARPATSTVRWGCRAAAGGAAAGVPAAPRSLRLWYALA